MTNDEESSQKPRGSISGLGLFRGKIQSVIPGDFWIYSILYMERNECAKRSNEVFRDPCFKKLENAHENLIL